MSQHSVIGLIVGLIALLIAPAAALGQDEAAPAPVEAAAALEAHWGGFVELPMLKLGIVVSFSRDAEGGMSGTIDIPVQGVSAMPLTDPVLDEHTLSFELPAVGAVCSLERNGDSAEGTLEQVGQQFPVILRRYASADEALNAIQPNRPQHPSPPFPYEAREVSIKNEAGGVTLAGTLTMPASREIHPAVILITGSGPQDRDETIADHKPFLVIADHLTRAGFAVLRYDDRGVGGSTGNTMQSTVLDFQGDVEAWLGWLKEQPGIDAGRIGLIGHSEGGSVAPLVAAGPMRDDVAFMVLLAGMALPGDEVVLGQTQALFKQAGFPGTELKRLGNAQQALLDALNAGAPDDVLKAHLGELIDIQSQATPMSEDQRNLAIEGQFTLVGSQWYRHLMAFDPRPALRTVACPILALNGALDLQVLPDEHLAAIEEAAATAGNDDVTTMKLEGLNHMFQEAESGLPAEYGVLRQTFAPSALEIMTEWLKARARVGQ